MHQKSESKSRNRVSARAKLEVSNVFYAYFILKQKNVKYGVFYYFSAVSFNYVDYTRGTVKNCILRVVLVPGAHSSVGVPAVGENAAHLHRTGENKRFRGDWRKNSGIWKLQLQSRESYITKKNIFGK